MAPTWRGGWSASRPGSPGRSVGREDRRGPPAGARGQARRAAGPRCGGRGGVAGPAVPRSRERRIGWAEAATRADGARDDEEASRAALAGLSTEQLSDLAAECLVAHGADPATAREGWLNSWRLGVRGQGSTWA